MVAEYEMWEGENPMKYAVSLLLGAILGALIALLFAPSSGEELRSNIKTQADVQAARARDELQKGVQVVQDRVGKLKKESPPVQEIEAIA
jgi:gas vesicle protein